MTRSVVIVLIVTALIAYPLAIYFSAGHVAPKFLMAGVLTLLSLRVIFKSWRKSQHSRAWVVFAGGLLLAAIAVLFTRGLSLNHLRLYPVAIDAAFFLVFFISLFTRRPLVERIARASSSEDFGPEVVRYTYRATWAWSVVLLVNTTIALCTALYGSLAIWTLYNGLLSYLLIGATFAVEYIIRSRVRRLRIRS